VNKKEAKKTLLPACVPPPVPHTPEGEQKFFWFFFFKKRTAFLPGPGRHFLAMAMHGDAGFRQ
jgi:hypothetical protein